MQLQEIFDKVVLHLRKQGTLCEVENNCRYRLNDKACAIGCLIPWDQYDPAMEGKPIEDLVVFFPSIDVAIEYQDGVKADLLEHLQRLHDIDEPKAWEKEFASLAEVFSLTLPPK